MLRDVQKVHPLLSHLSGNMLVHFPAFWSRLFVSPILKIGSSEQEDGPREGIKNEKTPLVLDDRVKWRQYRGDVLFITLLLS